MRVCLWGTRGSLAAPGPETSRYGGNTSCVEVASDDGTFLVLDAGTGIRRLGAALPSTLRRVDLLLTHLHMDHLQGLGFFAPLYHPGIELHIWGPSGITLDLHTRLTRYMSPPLFPVHLRDLPCTLHEVPGDDFEIGPFHITAQAICHPGPTVGYRITDPGGTLTYIPDHEPALGARQFPTNPEWTSGYELAHGADLLIHDAQYSCQEYAKRVGWGHSSVKDALAFAEFTGVKHLIPFHHDPAHTDEDLDRLFAETLAEVTPSFPVTPGMEGACFELGVRH